MKTRHFQPALDEQTPEVDMSPMIDLVFLLLIFFMTSSSMITFLKDRNVELPVAESAQVPKSVKSRLLVNVYAEGTYGDDRGSALSLADVKQDMQGLIVANPGFRLFIRADRRSAHRSVREFLDVARDVGVQQVIFSTFTAQP